MAKKSETFLTTGAKRGTIPVRISNGIIKHFSEGLYTSPHKAVEELVSNAYDAGARNVWVFVPPDLSKRAATVVVADDGTGMTAGGLKQHWTIGSSPKRTSGYQRPLGRDPIGRFGIGKLATYVLGGKLTHITHSASTILATTMDHSEVEGDDDAVLPEKIKTLSLPLRALTESQAAAILKPWFKEKNPLLRRGVKHWTVAILSDLHDMARSISVPRLKWVLSTAMPLRDDFTIFVNGAKLVPAKLKISVRKKWTLGKEIKKLDPDKIDITPDIDTTKLGDLRFGVETDVLGRVTGYFELYNDLLTSNKPAAFDRSHGFFCLRSWQTH